MNKRIASLLMAILVIVCFRAEAKGTDRSPKNLKGTAAEITAQSTGSEYVLRCRNEGEFNGLFCGNPTPGLASTTDHSIGVFTTFDGVTNKYILRFISPAGAAYDQPWTKKGWQYCSYYLFQGEYCSTDHVFHYEHYPTEAGTWTVQVLADGVVRFSEPLLVKLGVLVKSSGDAQTGVINTDARAPIVLKMTDFAGFPVSYPIWSRQPEASYVTYSISGPGGSSGQSVTPPEDTFTSSSTVSFHFGNKPGTYAVKATHKDASPLDPPFLLTAVERDEPDDNPDDEEGNGDDCSVADPVTIGIGNSFQQQTDYQRTGLSTLEFTRSYNALGSKSKLMRNYWTTSFDRAVLPPLVAGGPVRVRRPDGRVIPFSMQGSVYQPARPYFHETLKAYGTGWQYITEDNTTETYDAQGKWTAITDRVGRSLSATYNSVGNLTKVTANTGEYLVFAYNAYNAISTATDHSGRIWTYTYDGYANLVQLKDPDGLYYNYLYQSPFSPWWLTGIGVGRSPGGGQYVTWEYDATGRVTSNYFSGGQRRFDIAYNDATGERTVTDARSNQTVFKTRVLNGRGFVDDVIGPGFASCGFADAQLARDESMNITRQTIFGRVTEYGAYDAKGQAGFRIEAAGSPAARRTDYTYDPRFTGKPTTISRPSVAPGQTLVTQLTYDASANLIQERVSGFRPDGTAIVRTTAYEYAGPYGQLSKINGPRTDTADVTRFDYDPTSKRLLRVTDPNGIVLRNNISYTPTGQVATEDRPNGLHVVYTYYAGTDQLKSITETGGGSSRVSRWTYNDRRLVASLTVSDGINQDLITNFIYDAAGDLTQMSSPEDKIVFSLDKAGNRVQDTYSKLPVNSPTARWLQRTFDAYGRVRELINPNNRATYNVHPEGTLTTAVDGRDNATGYTYDDFKRLTQTLQPGQVATTFGYDAQDRLTLVTDGNQGTTLYRYDDLGNWLQLTSPDTGITLFEHDEAGNVSRMTDAKGQVTTYIYDAGNRLKTVDRVGTAADELYAYDNCTGGSGKLCSATNGIGDVISYEYDAWGRINKQTTNAGTVSYRYDAGNQISEITYPSLRKVRYQRNGSGQVVNVLAIDGGNPYPLATNISRLPFGPAARWTYGNGVVESRQYDLQYRPTTFDSGGRSAVAYSSYDGNGNPTQRTVNGDPQTFTYDNLDRLDTATGSFGTRDYNHDAVGNRTSLASNGETTSYNYELQSNRLASDNAWIYTRDANGNETRRQAADGRGFQFDYTANNRLLSATDLLIPESAVAAYRYNALGQRTVKSTSFGDTRFVYGLSGELLMEALPNGSIVQEYVYLDGKPIALLGVPAAPDQPFAVDQIVDNPTGISGCRNIKSQQAMGGSYLQCSTTNYSAPNYHWPWQAPVSGTYSVSVMWPWDSSSHCFRHEGGRLCIGPYNSIAPAPAPGSWANLGNLHLTAGRDSLWTSVQDQYIGNSEYRAEMDAARFVLLYPDVNDRDYKYIHTDELGTPLRVTDKVGTVVWHADYDPFGTANIHDDPDGNGVRQTLNLRFPGQYFDVETGLHYNYLRDYDPSLGRYSQSDPIGVLGGWNTYAYVGSNPIKSIDPLGLRALTDCEKSVLSNYYDAETLNGVDVHEGLPWFVVSGFSGITIGPYIYLENDRPNTAVGIAVIGHEIAHTVQQFAYGTTFPSIYGMEALIGLLSTGDRGDAHDSIGFEKQGMAMEQKILADLARSEGMPCGCQ